MPTNLQNQTKIFSELKHNKAHEGVNIINISNTIFVLINIIIKIVHVVQYKTLFGKNKCLQ